MAGKYPLLLLLLMIAGYGLWNPVAAQSPPDSYLVEQGIVKGDPYESERFPVNRAVELSVFTLSGNVEIYENPDIDYVQVDLYIDRGFSFWSGSPNLDNYRIIFQQVHDKITASVEPRRGDSRVWKGENISFSYVVQTPVELQSRIRNTKGDIYARGIRGSHQIQATVGNLYLDDLEGEINAYSASGNIRANGMRGLFNAKTTNGNIDVGDADGEMRIRSVTGSITAENINGTFIAATTTGSVDAGLLSVGEGSYIETVAGSVNLRLPPSGMNYSIEASGSSVDINRLLENREFEGRVTGRSARVTLGAGDIPIQVSTVAGHVIITRGS